MSTPSVRHVVIHRPGPAWQPGVDFREQPGVVDHVAHYRGLHQRGQLMAGGPYLVPDGGGMMIASADLSGEEINEFAADDPAVRSGLLTFEVLPWFVAMEATG